MKGTQTWRRLFSPSSAAGKYTIDGMVFGVERTRLIPVLMRTICCLVRPNNIFGCNWLIIQDKLGLFGPAKQFVLLENFREIPDSPFISAV